MWRKVMHTRFHALCTLVYRTWSNPCYRRFLSALNAVKQLLTTSLDIMARMMAGTA
jgi:hypothetical protein